MEEKKERKIALGWSRGEPIIGAQLGVEVWGGGEHGFWVSLVGFTSNGELPVPVTPTVRSSLT